MPLLDELTDVCHDLADYGWAELLQQVAGLNIKLKSKELAGELNRELNKIDRTILGFEDFAAEGCRGIEPGVPSRSLLFHALAKPLLGVWPQDGSRKQSSVQCKPPDNRRDLPRIKRFPRLHGIEVIENYVYGAAPPSLAELRRKAGDAPLALLTCVAEYRPAAQTVHQKYADMCYSRTGVARIGSEEHYYLECARGFTSSSDQRNQIRVVPARYSAYVAMRVKGGQHTFGILRPIGKGTKNSSNEDVAPDETRSFWVPLHKVFSGEDCIRGLDLRLELQADHRNEKLRRVMLYQASKGASVPYCAFELENSPFVIPQKQLIKFTDTKFDSDWHELHSSILVCPLPNRLVEPAEYGRKPIALRVPEKAVGSFGALHIPQLADGGRTAPEFIYVQMPLKDGKGRERHDDSFDAQLFIDHTGDGYVKIRCPQLALDLAQAIPAYSILAAPDPYPAVKQQDIFDWWQQSAPVEVRATLFPDSEGDLPVEPLSDARLAANTTYTRTPTGPASFPPPFPATTQPDSIPVFDIKDDTYTAIVSGCDSSKTQSMPLDLADDKRVSPLPDGAAGLFAPGWDVSVDVEENGGKPVPHLAAYGGGLPFLEDARICAALSGFWPAVAPDTSRQYAKNRYPSVTPIPDHLLGWDGVPPPAIIKKPAHDCPGIAELNLIAHTDYIRQYAEGGLDFRKLEGVTVQDYKLWTLLMCRVYQAIGAATTADKAAWSVIQFERPNADALQEETDLSSLKDVYYFLLIKPDRPSSNSSAPKPPRIWMEFSEWVRAYASPSWVKYMSSANHSWTRREF